MDDIKKSFIVNDEEYLGSIKDIAERTLKYGRITKNGTIIIDDKRLAKDDILKLCLVIKFIANKLDESFQQHVRPSDVIDCLNERVESVGSRLSLLVKSGFAKKDGYGLYVVNSYKIDNFLNSLTSGENKKITKVRKGGENKKLTGVGLDIQELIDNNFFNLPKLINEVVAELKRETKFHDAKVVDKTIRDIFVGKRKILKRIVNEKGGRSQWAYIIRK